MRPNVSALDLGDEEEEHMDTDGNLTYGIPADLRKLMVSAWSTDPKERPSMESK